MLSRKLNKLVIFIAAALAVGLSSQAYALGQGDWLVRFGAVSVNPNDSSGQVGTIAGSGVSVNSSQGIFANLSYMLTGNLSVEVLAATPFSHDIYASGSIASLGKIAEVKQLPPTVSLQYHFMPKSSFRPYVGAGINYTTFFNAKTTGSTVTSISLDNSWGPAVQVGFDKDINKDWFFNADLRYIKIKTTATTNVGNVNVTIDPWVVSIGVGTQF